MAARFEDYVATRSVALQRFAYLICRDVEDARDLVQDALLGLYPRWASVVAKGNPDAYVKRSIVNAGISKWRRSGREHPTDVADLGDIAPDHAGSVTDAEVAWAFAGDAHDAAAKVADYEHGWSSDIETDFAPKGLNEDTVRFISANPRPCLG